jgi:Uma2 family endonuclease
MSLMASTDKLDLDSARTKARWTCEEYEALGELPPLRGRRTELIDGEIFFMPAMKDPHAVAVGLCDLQVRRVFSDQKYLCRMQLPVQIGTDNEPEPDISVVLGPPRRYLGKGHPREAFLLIEVADTSIRIDLGVKASMYALMGLQDYWVLDLNERRLVVHRQSIVDSHRSHGYFYKEIGSYGSGDFVEPLAVPGAKVAVADLLP